MTLNNARVVIIGGTSGIGLATAHAAIDAGAEVVIASSRQSSVDTALNELTASATGHALDVLDEASVAAFFAQVGDFDHLVFTAGEPLSLLAVDGLDLDQARAFFQIRYFGALNAVSKAVSHIRPAGPSPSRREPPARAPEPAGPSHPACAAPRPAWRRPWRWSSPRSASTWWSPASFAAPCGAA
ncbi:SDR family NAD(P)-dependent oxidoreductase [Modestobacter sp. L9-4]|nr:SDR family NAD(P)-dependent oxidoreductase [Modestobacter sp. L9-4]